jgi:hypothetical protein
MKFNSFFKIFLFGFLVVFVASCDKDVNEIGADFVDSDHYTFTSAKYDVKAYNQSLGPVQTNNLPVNALGYYNNPVFGTTKASFVTQLELATVNPTFYKPTNQITVDSVYLHVPYFSRQTAIDVDGNSTYELDSIYGSGKIQLDVYRSNYYLRNLDPNPVSGLLESQSYFSDARTDIEQTTLPTYPNRLNDDNDAAHSYQNDNFEFRNTEIKFITGGTVKERLTPGIYMDLKKSVFYDEIINTNSANLLDNNAFKNHFRGLYFKVTPHADNLGGAALAQLNFAQGRIVVVYTDWKSDSDHTDTRKTLTLNMKGHTVDLLENGPNSNSANATYNAVYNGALTSPNYATGDPRLYLKGGVGSMAIIELFRGLRNEDAVDPADPSYENPLHVMRREGWLINEANLVFNIDNDATYGMGAISDADIKKYQPNRIYLYDFTNKRPLIDYYFDTSTSSNTKFNKLMHSGIIQKVASTQRGTKYKVRITNYLRNLVKFGGSGAAQDSTNVKLGLVVTENINIVTSAKVKNPFSYYETNLASGLPQLKPGKYVPSMSVANPLGTILYGSNMPTSDPNYDKRLQLEIVYTKPD